MTKDATLFDLVPWPYGFVHSGVLAYLLGDESCGSAVLGSVCDAPWSDSARLTSEVRREGRVRGRAADLTFTVGMEGADPVKVALETKVQDALRPKQLQHYREAVYTPLVYLPGLTGLLVSGNARTPAREAVLTGRGLAEALADREDDMPLLLAQYLRTVRQEARRFSAALAQERGEPADIEGGETPVSALVQTAWLVAVLTELKTRRRSDADSTVYPVTQLNARDVAYDRGVFWGDIHTASRTDLDLDGIGLYIDIVATKANDKRAVIIKAGFTRDAGRLGAAYDHARRAGKPGTDWFPGRRGLSGTSVGCWQAPATGLSATETVDLAINAARWIRALA